jgi:hypothetical protein
MVGIRTAEFFCKAKVRRFGVTQFVKISLLILKTSREARFMEQYPSTPF